MSENKKMMQMQKKMDKLKEKLAETGLLLQGNISERNIQKGAGSKKKNYGPYYQWTFKQGGKTVTVNLAASQVEEFQKAIDNNKKIEATMEDVRNLSREILEISTQGVIRRKRNNELKNP
jgi:uncharacterized iron-regulated protein